MSERDGRLPRAVALLLALVSGVALDLSFPEPGWWVLAAPGIAGLAVAVRGASTRWGALLGLVAGLGCFVPLLHWSGVYVGALPWLALAVSQACFVALAGAGFVWAWRVPGGRAGTVLAVTGVWVLAEGLRARLPFGGFPWGRLAFSQADAPTLGWAAIGGAPLVSAVVAAAGGCLAVAVVALLTRPPRFAIRAGVGAAAAVALIVAGPLALTLGNVGSGGDARQLRVAAVQGDVPTAGLDFNAQRRAVLDNHVRATLALADAVRAGRTQAPDVVLWPENSSDIDPLRNLDAYAEIGRATDAVGVPLLVGAVLQGPGDRVSNAGIVWGPSGSAVPGPGQRYVKRHPVPFAEYIPYRSFFRTFSDKVDLVSKDFAAGDRVGVLQLGPAKIGDVICFEVAYDDIVHDAVAAGADLLVVQTNNATFGYTDESVQQIAMSRLRAVEAGRAVVHVSTVGVSGLVEPDGRVVAGSSLFTPAVLESTLPLRTGFTVATRLGALPEIVLAAAGALLVALAVLRTRRRGGTAPGETEDAAVAEPAVSGGAG
ncbi:MAG TPA: apolipoprotein N-acyltransferase [Kineosporiaceae bacterium]|nr:apolipoprotein N-acyltransferase [Kineosporiaceae bacterium]